MVDGAIHSTVLTDLEVTEEEDFELGNVLEIGWPNTGKKSKKIAVEDEIF